MMLFDIQLRIMKQDKALAVKIIRKINNPALWGAGWYFLGQHSTVDVDDLPRDIGAQIASEEHAGVSDVLRGSATFQRYGVSPAFNGFLVQLGGHFGFNESGSDDIGPDIP